MVRESVAELSIVSRNAGASLNSGLRLIATDAAGAATKAEQGGFISLLGHNGTVYTTGSSALISLIANELWVDGSPDSLGTRIEFGTTPDGTATRANALTIENDGAINVEIGPLNIVAGNLDVQAGDIILENDEEIRNDTDGYIDMRLGGGAQPAFRFAVNDATALSGHHFRGGGGASDNLVISAVGNLYLNFDQGTSVIVTNRLGVSIPAAGAPAASAALEIGGTTGALLLPRMNTTQRNALTAVNGMIIYNSQTNLFEGYENGAWRTL